VTDVPPPGNRGSTEPAEPAVPAEPAGRAEHAEPREPVEPAKYAQTPAPAKRPVRAKPPEQAELAQLHAPFRSRRGRIVGSVAAVGQAVALVTGAAILPWHGPDAVGWYDRAGFVVIAVLIGWVLYRLASVAAVPSESGLVVRNLLITRPLEWAEVIGIRFGSGDAWVLLDLSDGDTLAVMAIQRADGQRSQAEAERLATLIAVHSIRTAH
jgi:hypothetical protein